MTVVDWAQVGSAVGTLAAVIVALFGVQLQRLILPPRLDLSIKNIQGVDVSEELEENGVTREVQLRYFHLRVSNPHRWSAITAVRVYLLRIEDFSSGETPGDWRGEVPLPWRFPKEVPPALDIGFPRDCDLCAVGSDGVFRLFQATRWGFPGKYHAKKAPISLTLTLRARGLEADSRCLAVELGWDGSWPPDSAFIGKVRLLA
jgi:hypothetical protein